MPAALDAMSAFRGGEVFFPSGRRGPWSGCRIVSECLHPPPAARVGIAESSPFVLSRLWSHDSLVGKSAYCLMGVPARALFGVWVEDSGEVFHGRGADRRCLCAGLVGIWVA
jgi:hypothetical protein